MAAPSGNLRGIVAMVAAVGCFSLMDALLKTLSGSYPALQVAALRGWAALPLVALYVLWRGEVAGLLRVRWPLHLLRGVLNVSMLALFAYALRELGLAEAYTLFFIAPLLITALSTVVLREKVRAAHWVAIALGMAGVLVALRPSQEAFFTLGALAVLGEGLPGGQVVGLVVEEGGVNIHAAIVGLTLEVPVIIGATNATKILKSGSTVTVDSDKGIVYFGDKITI